MSDKELLELAAKAAGIGIVWTSPFVAIGDFAQVPNWNPLTDDGDALRLAVKLKLDFGFPSDECVWSFARQGDVCRENPSQDPYAATRRAIVRAAAEIGRGMR